MKNFLPFASINSVVGRATAFAIVAAGLFSPSDALAQEWVIAGTAEVGSGIEGGGQGYASGIRRARTQLRFGAEFFNNEFEEDKFGIGLKLELEPEAAGGVDLRYIRQLNDSFMVHVGAEGFFVPDTLFGISAGLKYIFPLSKTIDLTAGPTIPVYFLGYDLPDDTIVWQALLQVGVRADF